MAARPDDPDDAVPSPGADAPTPPVEPSAGTPDDDSDEARWAAIVAQLDDLAHLDGTEEEVEDDREDGDAAGTTPEAAAPDAGWGTDARVVRPAAPPPDSGRDWDGTGQYDDAEAAVDAEEHFVPPDPGPVLGGDPLLTMAWFAAVGMPIFLLVVLVAWRSAPPALVQAAAVVFVLGIGVLVWRMPHRRDPEDHDDGAVV